MSESRMQIFCMPCGQGYHFECGTPCCCGAFGVSKSGKTPGPVDSTGSRDGMVWSKPDADIKDLKSTGRKRAAKLYPLEREANCEWMNLAFAGGGLFPIPGCLEADKSNGKQEHRHHGPVLLTTANVEGNVHRICTACHNRWHSLNDAFVLRYMSTVLWRPHDSETLLPVDEVIAVVQHGHVEYARKRVAPESYSKSKHEYRNYLEELREKGVELVNKYLGV